jgi:hypothetical protein
MVAKNKPTHRPFKYIRDDSLRTKIPGKTWARMAIGLKQFIVGRIVIARHFSIDQNPKPNSG